MSAKIRTGFVSNSSSSSFILSKNLLEDEQIDLIINHKEYGKEILERLNNDRIFKIVSGVYNFSDYEFDATGYNEWNIKQSDNFILLETNLDNFNMEQYLEIIRATNSIINYRNLDEEDSNEIDLLRIS